MKMKIKIQNKKNLALFALFLLINFLAFIWFFYLGYKYGNNTVSSFTWIPNVFRPKNFSFSTEWNIKNWNIFSNQDFGFSFLYPKEMEMENPVGLWKYFADTTSGIQLVKLKVPKIYEINTNFSDAYFNIGISTSTKDIQNCFLSSNGEVESSSTVSFGNATFYEFSGQLEANGDYYNVKSYRTLHHNICYDIDLVTHFTDINSYPSDFNLQNFNQQKVDDLLNKVLNTFYFTN